VASIRNIIETMFVMKGAEKAAASTQNVTKAQTRLGQASSSAGRQFSAQSAGLGGLVAAYAGAAANVFAITQAFGALQRAARAEATIAGTRTLAAAVGESADSIIGNLRDITQGQLSIAQAAEVANFQLSSGFDSKQIEGLALVAVKASKALGRDLTDSLSRLSRGVAKIEPEILDELGIIVRLDDAVKKYALSIGKASSDLTTFERSQAFANAVIEQGTDKYAAIDEKASSTIKTFEQLSAQVQDLITQIGGLVASALGPFIQLISGNFLNVLASVGLVGGLVFGKLGQVAKEGLSTAGAAVERAGQGISNFFDKTGGQGAAKLTASLKGVNLSFKGLTGQLAGLTQKERLAAQGLLKLAKDGSITAAQMKQLDAILQKNTGTLVSLKGAAAAASTGVQGLGKAALFASRAASFAGKAFSLAAKGVNLFIGAVSKIFFVVSIIQLISSTLGKLIFGVDPLVGAGKKVQEFFEKFRQGAQKAKVAAEAVTAAAQQMSGLGDVLSQITTPQEQRGQFSFLFGSGEASPEKVKGKLTEISNAFQKTLQTIDKLSDPIQVRTGVAMLQRMGIVDTREVRQRLREITAEVSQMDLNGAEKRAEILKRISPIIQKASIEGQIAAVKKEYPKLDAVILQQFKASLEKQAELSRRDEGLGDSIKASQTSAGQLARQFVEEYFATVGDGTAVAGTKLKEVFQSLGNQYEKTDEAAARFVDSLAFLNIQLGKDKTIDGASQVAQYAVKLEAGTMSTEKLSEAIKVLGKELEKAENDTNGVTGAIEALIFAAKEQQAIKAIGDQFDKLFPPDALKQGAQFVMITKEGIRLARTEREVREASVRSLVELTKYEGDNNVLKDRARKSLESLARRYPQLTSEIDKQEKALEKLNKQLTLQLDTLIGQIKIQSAENAIKNRANAIKDEESALKRTADLNKSNLALEKERVRVANLKLDLQIAQKREKIEELKYELQLEQLESSRIKARIEDADRRARLRLSEQSQIQSAFSNLFSDADRRALERKGLELDVTKAEKLLEEQKRLSQKEIETAKKIFTERKAIADLEFKKGKALLDLRKQEIQESQRAAQAELDALKKRGTGGLEADKTDRITIANTTKAAAIAQAEAAKQSRDLQIEKIKADAEFLTIQVEALEKHPEAMRTVFNGFLVGFDKIVSRIPGAGSSGGAPQIEATATSTNNLAERARALGDSANTAQSTSEAIFNKQVKIAEDAATQSIAEAGRQFENEKATLENRKKILENNLKIEKERLKALGIEGQILEQKKKSSIASATRERDLAIANSKDKVAAAEREVNAAKEAIASFDKLSEILGDKLVKVANKVAGIIGDNLADGMDKLLDAINDGTLTMDNFKQGFKDMVRNILADTQKAFMEEFILQPVKDSIGGFIRGLVLPDAKLEEAAKFETLAQSINEGNETVAKVTGDALQKQSQTLTEVFGSVTNVMIVGQTGPVLVTTSGAGLGPQGVLGQAGANRDVLKESDANIFAEEDDFGGLLAETGDASKGLGSSLAGTTEAVAGTTGGFSLLNGKIPLLNMSITDVIGKIGDFGTSLVGSIEGLFSGIFGGGSAGGGSGLFGTIFSGISGIFGGGAAAATAPAASFLMGIGAAGGILVASGELIRQMNSGGAVMRDSVPALLEPGEFVMRKSAVDKAGLPAMQAMNSGSSQKNNMPPVKVQVENTGQPKEAQADTKMDGEAMIIKIITKDLSSNGPIRRSIRQNAR